jgi:hypothetical protein
MGRRDRYTPRCSAQLRLEPEPMTFGIRQLRLKPEPT